MINKDEITVSRKKSFCQAKNEFLPKNPLKHLRKIHASSFFKLRFKNIKIKKRVSF
jgi:hypothetical protein